MIAQISHEQPKKTGEKENPNQQANNNANDALIHKAAPTIRHSLEPFIGGGESALDDAVKQGVASNASK